MRFTDKQIQNLKPRASRYQVREASPHGFGTLAVRVSPNGGKSWAFLYTFDGRDRRMTLGRYPAVSVAEAHAAAGEAMRKVERGEDPAAEVVAARVVARKAPTFAELAALYLERHARPNKRAGSVAKDEGMLAKDLLPAFGVRKADAVERADVREVLRRIVDRGSPIQANRTLAVLRKIYNWGIAEDLVTRNPCLGLPAPGRETQRDRVLNDGELQTFLSRLGEAPMSAEVRLILRLQLLTAQRCGEVMGARWSEIDTASGWWTIPGDKAKNGLSHRVPLSPQALATLADARALNPDRETVFPSPRGDRPMVVTAVGLAVRRTQDYFGIEQWTPHDLRRTAASHMTSMGVPRLVVSKVLNHAEQGVTAVYDRHSYDKDKREALDAWGRRVAALEAAAGRGLAVVAGGGEVAI